MHNLMRLALAGILTVVTLVVALMPPAAAPVSATASCNADAYYYYKGHRVRVPVHYWLPQGETTTKTTTRCLMGVGSSGQGVEALQHTLNQCYDAGLAMDGIFGPRTRAALINAQRRAGTTPDGVYGPNTRDALRWRVNHYGCLHLSKIR